MAFYRNSSCRKHNDGQRNNEHRPIGEDAQDLPMSTGAGRLPWLVHLLDTWTQKEAHICRWPRKEPAHSPVPKNTFPKEI